MYVYIIRVRVEGLVVLDVVPRTAGLSDELVHERITICKAIGGLACGEELLHIIAAASQELARRGEDTQEGLNAQRCREPTPWGLGPAGCGATVA